MKTEHSENIHQWVRGRVTGSFGIYDGDGSENITQKVNSRSFKLLPSNFISFSLSSFGIFFLELNSKGPYLKSEKEKFNRFLVFASFTNVKLRSFTLFSCNNGNEMYKKA